MDKTQTISIAYDRIKFIAIVFCMSSICSYDHEIMQLCSNQTSNSLISVHQCHPWIGNADMHST